MKAKSEVEPAHANPEVSDKSNMISDKRYLKNRHDLNSGIIREERFNFFS
jgi:hypothetical protein